MACYGVEGEVNEDVVKVAYGLDVTVAYLVAAMMSRGVAEDFVDMLAAAD